MNCMVVDDDELTRVVIEKYVHGAGFLNLVASCPTPSEAAVIAREKKPDLIFLDVEMPEMNGFDFMRQFGDNMPAVILITAHKKYAADAFDFSVIDFLVKPISPERFRKAVEKSRKLYEFDRLNKVQADTLYVKTATQLIKIDPREILFIKSLGDYVIIHTPKEKLTTHSTMKGMAMKLSGKDFLRVHHSYIVRLDKISQFENNAIRTGDYLLPVSRSNKKELLNRLKTLAG